MKSVGNTYNDLDPVQCIGHIFFHNNKVSFKISSHIYLFSHHLSGCTLPIPQCSGCFHHDLWHTQIILTDPHSCVTKVRTHPSPERWKIKQDLLLCFAFPHSPTSHVPPGPCRQPLPMVTGKIFRHQSLLRLLPSGNCRDTGTIWLEFPAGRVEPHLSQLLCEEKLSHVTSIRCLHFLICKMKQYKWVHYPWLNNHYFKTCLLLDSPSFTDGPKPWPR